MEAVTSLNQEETETDIPPRPSKELLRKSTTSMLSEEENYPDPGSLQEELNEILEAFYECVSEADIRAYQEYVENVQGQKIAEQALMEPAMAPSFELKDQDRDIVNLHDLLKQGPVVLIFYRGKWCPHCNATLMRYQKSLLPALRQFNASMVAISPMMEDGTAYLASKRDLEFSVCSDFDNTIAREFQITFTVQPHLKPFFQNWGENIPEFSGVDSWEIPLPATYVIAPDGRIAWSFIDNDPGIRGEVQDIIHQVATVAECTTNFREETQSACSSTTSAKKEKKRPLFNRTIGYTFKSLEFRKLWKSKRDSDEVQNGQNDREDTSRLSVRSDLSVEHIKRTPRRRGRTQSAKEFLGSYMLPS